MSKLNSKKQSGFSIIELMVAVLIGLILIAGTFTIFVANSESFRLQRALSESQEAGRFALDFIAQDLRQAETVDAGTVVDADEDTGLLADSDSITVNYTPVTEQLDCQGNLKDEITNHYYVAEDNGVWSLFCDGDGGTSGDALVQGVEGFQVQYGLMDPNGRANGTARASLYAESIGASDRVASVRVGLLIRSADGIQGLAPVNRDIPLLRSDVPQASLNAVLVNNQPVVHRLYVSTAFLRNVGL